MARHENLSIGVLALTGGSVRSASYTPAAVAANTVVENANTISMAGVSASDIIIPVANPISNNTAVVKARASAADTVAVTFANVTGGSLTPTAGTYTFLVIKQS